MPFSLLTPEQKLDRIFELESIGHPLFAEDEAWFIEAVEKGDINTKTQIQLYWSQKPKFVSELVEFPCFSSAMLEALLQNNIFPKNDDPNHPLMFKLIHNAYQYQGTETISFEKMKKLVAHQVCSVLDTTSEAGTQIQHAASFLFIPMSLWLIEQGADPFQKDKYGLDAFDVTGVDAQDSFMNSQEENTFKESMTEALQKRWNSQMPKAQTCSQKLIKPRL